MIMTPWGRVGSNLLLNSFGQLIGRIPRRLVNETLNRFPGADDQLAWIRAFYTVDDGAPLVGSKQNILALADRERVGGLLAELEISLIRLRRDNLVKVAVSQLRAEIYAQRSKSETGVAAWGVRPNRQPLGPETLDPARFVQVAADARRAGEWLRVISPRPRGHWTWNMPTWRMAVSRPAGDCASGSAWRPRARSSRLSPRRRPTI